LQRGPLVGEFVFLACDGTSCTTGSARALASQTPPNRLS
jgi:hypothetical protein